MHEKVIVQTKIKKCSKCKAAKNNSEFSTDNSKKDGLTSACRKCNNNREKKRRENGGDFTKEQKIATFKKYGGFCQICRSTRNLEIDHKLPQNICEPNTASIEDNAWVLCKSCNIAKSNKIILEVIAEVPGVVLKPMLLRKYAKEILRGRFDKVRVTIGKEEFTEIKVNFNCK